MKTWSDVANKDYREGFRDGIILLLFVEFILVAAFTFGLSI